MNIEIQSQKFSLTTALKNYARKRLNFALGNQLEYINNVTMRLSDINGPRGGADKRCLIVIQLFGMSNIVIKDVETDMYTAIDRACNRAGRTIVRKLGRHLTLMRSSKTPALENMNEQVFA
jgi:ribosomal subunit interface protein